MPRVTPIKQRDLEIVERLREIRTSERCSRAYLAKKCYVDPDAIVRVELGRVPLKYDLARKIVWALQCNAGWLANGVGDKKQYVMIPTATELGEPENAIFSDVFSRRLAPAFEAVSAPSADENSSVNLRAASALMMHGFINRWICDVPDGFVQELAGQIQRAAFEFLRALPKDSAERRLARAIWFNLMVKNPDRIGDALKKDLPNSATSPNVAAMKPKDLWPTLKRELQSATNATTGAKTALADYLGVELSRVSQWLSDSKKTAREPGAEYALLMQAWLKDPKRAK